MLDALLLCGAAVGISAQNVLKKYYNGKTDRHGVFIFAAISAFVACLFFLISSGFKLDFCAEVIPYSLGFAVSYAAASVGSFLAIQSGSLSLTSLINSYSLVVPTFYSLIFFGESVSGIFWVGFALLMISLFLINSREGEVKITLKWVVFVVVGFLGNGICSTVQAAEQRAFAGAYKSEFMIMALTVVALSLFTASLCTERDCMGDCLKRGGHLMAGCGVANGAVNLFIMLLLVRMSSAAVIYPVISAGGIVLSWSVSRFLYKENLTKKQNLALVLGIVSVVLMNL